MVNSQISVVQTFYEYMSVIFLLLSKLHHFMDFLIVRFVDFSFFHAIVNKWLLFEAEL